MFAVPAECSEATNTVFPRCGGSMRNVETLTWRVTVRVPQRGQRTSGVAAGSDVTAPWRPMDTGEQRCIARVLLRTLRTGPRRRERLAVPRARSA